MDYFSKYENHKKIIFHELPNQHAKLLVQLFYDGLKQGEFFRAIMEGYIGGDENIFAFIQNYKLQQGKSKTSVRKIKKEKINSSNIEQHFGLAKEEIEDIFDILEQELLKT